MKTKGAVLWGLDTSWSVEEIEIGEPRAGEVAVRLETAGLCRADHNLVTGAIPMSAFPVLGGHEGAGVVTAVGPGVSDLAAGDHVVTSFLPSCGRCPSCQAGVHNLCDLGAGLLAGTSVTDRSFRVHARGRPVHPMSLVGTFAPYAVVHRASVVKIDPSIPFDIACLAGCQITTGYGSAVHTARIAPGEDVAIIGLGGVGASALQGAVLSGARQIFVVESARWKRDRAVKFGATEVYPDIGSATEGIAERTGGRMCQKVVVTTGRYDGHELDDWLRITARAGTCVLTARADVMTSDLKLDLSLVPLLQKNLQGSLYGGGDPHHDIPEVLALHKLGDIDLAAAPVREYRLEQINDAYAELLGGHDLRGIIRYTDADR
ncbi:NDMA-dependent alcohol dehydrogenase [Nocardia sp. NPDC057227]|uniref:NDMA-dependent alcohol dehydrogenase n=1 Tax=Nocardia sp. NPDC057227 TaxID=3346056 RepID=UPI0036453ADC